MNIFILKKYIVSYVPSSDSTIICNICKSEVRVTDVQNGMNFDEYYLSCGHIQNVDRLDKERKPFDVDNKKSIVENIVNEYHTTCNICGLTARTIKELEDHKYHAHPNKGEYNKRSSEQNINPSP
ncbi:MAG TPA: hypothetical protein VFC05_15055 [Nitrososphaeraceae archaeon]|nr:hypothetical protein [Nitrososphaeraceae archaeon]